MKEPSVDQWILRKKDECPGWHNTWHGVWLVCGGVRACVESVHGCVGGGVRACVSVRMAVLDTGGASGCEFLRKTHALEGTIALDNKHREVHLCGNMPG